jgi:hypothetical protein
MRAEYSSEVLSLLALLVQKYLPLLDEGGVLIEFVRFCSKQFDGFKVLERLNCVSICTFVLVKPVN